MKTGKIASTIAVALLAGSLYTSIAAKEKPAAPPSKQAVELATADNAFGMKLFRKLHKEGDNTFISPASIAICLQMARQAAGGETRSEMDKAMEIEGLDPKAANKDLLKELKSRDGVKLSIANSLWADPSRLTLNPEYVTEVEENFDSEARTADFSDPGTVDVINTWISDKTNALIKDMLDEIPVSAIAYLINAIYFKGEWSAKFLEKQTDDANFTLNNGKKKKIKLMYRDADFVYGEDTTAQFIKVPYGEDKQAAMWIVLPKEGTSLDTVVTSLDTEALKRWRSGASSRKGVLQLPRFKLRYKKNLNESLQALGITKAFSLKQAEFDRLGESRTGDICITRVLHEAVVIVNEEGTEAAAATIVEADDGGGSSGGGPKPFRMTCDKPFLFFITDEPTGAVLFIGTCYNPESE